MTQITCSECGNPLQGFESTCPECGCPVSSNSNSFYQIDEGDNDAEDVLRGAINFIKNFIIILAVIESLVALIAGIILITESYTPLGIVLIIAAVLGIPINILIAKLIWAAGMIFINISTNVRIIKRILKNN